jgi:hypothetical protein
MRLLLFLTFAAVMIFGRFASATEHPGNVYLAGEDVSITVPAAWGAWRAIDVDGKEVGRGTSSEKTADLGKLPVGYFEVRPQEGPERVTAAVLAKSTFSADTPIALDAAMSWFYSDPDQIRGACRLCRLAGVTWVRDRASWPEIETARGTWAGDTRYETAMRIQHEQGLKILQVNHISPAWATDNPKRFPEDLRDVYLFYRGLAKRWNGLADAIEPWNEPDIDVFGGHTGCEIASFHKAAALGLKDGSPDQIVCGTVFASDRAETLDEFAANEAYPYFDRYNLHHYIGLPAYPRAYGRHRAVSGGRPMWTTEFNLTINWADEATKEPSEEDLRVQAFRVSKVFATALHEGVEKAFYFILGHYVERNLQYGLVHSDLTPRPAYVAFAAVGRLLNDAKPIGRVELGDEKLRAFAFKTAVDGDDKETVVAWSETHKTSVKIPGVESCYDYLGREMTNIESLELTRSPLLIVLPRGGSKELNVVPPPRKPKQRIGKPCAVVVQILGQGNMAQSAFELDDSRKLRLVVYNFGNKEFQGELRVKGGAANAGQVKIRAGGREECAIENVTVGTVTVRLDLGAEGVAVASARTILPVPSAESHQ